MDGVTIRARPARHLMTTWWVKVSPSLTVISSNPSIFAMSKKLKVSSTLNSRKMGVARADEVSDGEHEGERAFHAASALDRFIAVIGVTAPGLSRRHGAKEASGTRDDPGGGRQPL